jgi:hypothetical protein
MSDVPQGSGWWQASDGKWYPPELRPGPETPPAPQQAQVTQPPAAAPVQPAPTPAAEPVAPAATWTPQAAPAAQAAPAPAAAAAPTGPSRKWIPQTIIIVDIAILIITLGLVLLQG